MKKRFLKWLGFDVNAIQTLQNDVVSNSYEIN